VGIGLIYNTVSLFSSNSDSTEIVW